MKNILIVYPFFFLFACNSASKNENSENSKFTYPKEITSIIENFELHSNDFLLNEKFMGDSIKNNTKNLLSLENVRFLASTIHSDSISEINQYYLKDYFTIEQAKKKKKYEEYLSKLDIGMMKDANCYALNRLEFGDSLAILIWKIEFSSYEACPYYEGTHFLASLIADNKLLQTIQLATEESSADAPITSKTLQTGKISEKGIFNFAYESTVSEMGEIKEEVIEHVSKKKEFFISKKGFVKK